MRPTLPEAPIDPLEVTELFLPLLGFILPIDEKSLCHFNLLQVFDQSRVLDKSFFQRGKVLRCLEASCFSLLSGLAVFLCVLCRVSHNLSTAVDNAAIICGTPHPIYFLLLLKKIILWLFLVGAHLT